MTLTLSLLLKGDATQMIAALKAAGVQVDGLAKKTRDGAGVSDTDAAAKKRAADAALKLAGANRMVAGSVGNLVAQFNDVGMMMAAGQNPFMLAIQQGSQISQVIGPMGAAGAVKALGGAFLGMLAPVNLAVYGSVAGLALVTQWLFSAGDEAETAQDKMAEFADSVGRLDAILNRVEAYQFDGKFDGIEADAAKIEARFRTILDIVGEVQAASLQSALDAVREPDGLREAMEQSLRQAEVAARYGTEAPSFEYMGLESLYEAKLVMTSLREIEGETREEILKSVEATSEKLMLLGLLTPQVQQHLATIAEELGLHQQIAETVATRAANEEAAAERVSELVAMLLVDLNAAASVNLASVFANASGPAARLLALAGSIAGQMAVLVSEAAAMDAASLNYGKIQNTGASGPDAARSATQWSEPPPSAPQPTGAGRASVVTSGGGAGAAKAEADAVAELIERLREEQQVLLETDPVKAELAKHREVLADATEAERAEIEQLIAAEIQLKAVREAADFFGQESLDFLKGIARGGEDAKNAVDALLNSLLEAALQALWLGEGPLASLFGISGGIFDAILGVPGKAEGGMIYGDGGGTADKVPVMMSPGEFAVNARSTARYRPVLERINAGGDLPGFAAGGMIGGGGFAAAAGPSAAGGPMTVNVNVDGARGSAEIEEAVIRGVEGGLQLYRREGLPVDIKTVLRQRGRVTG